MLTDFYNDSATVLIPANTTDGMGGYTQQWYAQDEPLTGCLSMPSEREIIDNQKLGVESFPKWIGAVADVKVGYRLHIDDTDYDVIDSKIERRMRTQPPFLSLKLRKCVSSVESSGSSGTLLTDSDTDVIEGIAGENLGGQRLVVMQGGKLYYADKDTPSHINAVTGLTLSSVVVNQSVRVMREGPVIEPSWNWEADKPLFLGNNGLMTQTVPISGFLLMVGTPETTKKIILELKTPIKLV